MAREGFRRAFGGYDPSQVDKAIAERDARLQRTEQEAQWLARRLVETEQRLQQLTGADVAGAAGALSRRLEEIHDQARRQATRIRMAALEDAVQISERVKELTNLRDELGAKVSELAGMAGIRLGADENQPATGTEAPPAAGNGVYSGAVEVDVGPLRDFAQLSGFEDAAAGIDSASEIRVQRFTDGRATFSMNFGEPVELLRELEERAPFEFKVRDTRNDGVILDVDDGDHAQPDAA
ncbi:MAG TPA: hypothetical protein VHH72_00545 [Solirubrobacterales bacterium]|jgi:hypothetical protein|nr:hypothetical protein [Solirubrobacterales bacterium]